MVFKPILDVSWHLFLCFSHLEPSSATAIEILAFAHISVFYQPHASFQQIETFQDRSVTYRTCQSISFFLSCEMDGRAARTGTIGLGDES
jgi:hypothetical protein